MVFFSFSPGTPRQSEAEPTGAWEQEAETDNEPEGFEPSKVKMPNRLRDERPLGQGGPTGGAQAHRAQRTHAHTHTHTHTRIHTHAHTHTHARLASPRCVSTFCKG